MLYCMINGLTRSGIVEVASSQEHHYRQLNHIVNQHSTGFTQLSPSLASIVHHRKNNHLKWKRFQLHRQHHKLQHDNQQHHLRLTSIKMGNSQYSLVRSRSLTPQLQCHSKQMRQSRQQIIDQQNPQIAKRIIQAQGQLNVQQQLQDYLKSRQEMKRLQRYPIIQRMTALTSKRASQMGWSAPHAPLTRLPLGTTPRLQTQNP